jgi:hypothetical protein
MAEMRCEEKIKIQRVENYPDICKLINALKDLWKIESVV